MRFQIRNLKFENGRLAETDQRRSEEPKSLARYQERPPFFNRKENQNYVCTQESDYLRDVSPQLFLVR
jgi:hypothetical protein